MHQQLNCWMAFCCLAVVTTRLAWAADPAEKWEKDIQKFEASDKVNMPKRGGVLFAGSSSIRQWKTDKWFPGLNVINRGFGGSQMSDLNYYMERIVLKYRPRVIAVYEGDNDINKGKTVDQVFADYRTFLERVSKELPETQVIYIPIKPSLKRWELWPTMMKANQLIRDHVALNPRWHYVDIATPMLGDDGKPREELFVDDGLHLNEAGYEIWSGLLRPLLQ